MVNYYFATTIWGICFFCPTTKQANRSLSLVFECFLVKSHTMGGSVPEKSHENLRVYNAFWRQFLSVEVGMGSVLAAGELAEGPGASATHLLHLFLQ